ncbi:phosphatase PAP2 family protein [Allosphingosinicella sp.]|jgi:membrane-associated phospholipid phosphatase|uniref:phosphatase PAP2 family protein n=1 Tax=Allosphingosinicella sp. TaxID=2823234 RepID=UPI002EE60890
MTGGQRRAVNALWTAALLFVLLAVAGIAGLDAPVAQWTATLQRGEATIWAQGTAALDTVALKDISNFLLGAVLLIAAVLLLLPRNTRPLGRILLYVGTVQFLATTVADLLKPQFGRLRPFETVADIWLVGANSFPSGHAAFYSGLFLPLIILFPRWSLALAVPPLFVAAGRVLSHDHYLSDVSASLALAAALAAGLAFLVDEDRH